MLTLLRESRDLELLQTCFPNGLVERMIIKLTFRCSIGDIKGWSPKLISLSTQFVLNVTSIRLVPIINGFPSVITQVKLAEQLRDGASNPKQSHKSSTRYSFLSVPNTELSIPFDSRFKQMVLTQLLKP